MEITHIDTQFEPLIRAKEAAKYLGFAELTVERMARAGRLPSIAFPVGKTSKYTYRFRISELAAYVDTLQRHPISIECQSPNNHSREQN
jgi:excisionase family DNA binding protein